MCLHLSYMFSNLLCLLLCLLPHLPAEGESCASQLQELHKLLVEVQGVVNYGSFDTSGEGLTYVLCVIW